MSVEARVAELWQSEMVPEDEVERFEENKMEENRSYETTFHMQSEVDKLFLSVDVNILFFSAVALSALVALWGMTTGDKA